MTARTRPRRAWSSLRVPVAVLLLLAVAAFVAVAGTAGRDRRRMAPDGAAGAGARALVVLLRGRGVAVDAVGSPEQAAARAGPDTTVLVANPFAAPTASLAALRRTAADLVLTGPDDQQLSDLGLPLHVAGEVPVGARAAGCALPAARTAGVADLGGRTYRLDDAGAALTCYPVRGRPSVVALTRAERSVTVVGTDEPFVNDHLGERGNAALAIGLLDRRPRLLWLVLHPRLPERPTGQGLLDLLPPRLLWSCLQVAVAVVLLALWRARRLGRLAVEPLPVVVRAAEVVEGRARLYRSARSRDAAAAALREAAVRRLGGLLRLPPEPAPEVVVEAAARRTGRPAESLRALLYGAEPADDAALVRLADDLDRLDAEVRRP